MRVAVIVASVILSSFGCSGADATAMVRMQAAQDFVCAESTIDVRKEMDGTYAAVGCGKHGVYRAVCEGTRCAVSKEGEGLKSPPPRGLAPEPGGMGP